MFCYPRKQREVRRPGTEPRDAAPRVPDVTSKNCPVKKNKNQQIEGQPFAMMQIKSKLKLEFFPDLNGENGSHLLGLSSFFDSILVFKLKKIVCKC